MTPAPWFYVDEDEAVLLRLRAPLSYALVVFLSPAIGLTVLLAAALTARTVIPAAAAFPAWPAWATWGALLAILALAAWRRAATTEYVLTDERIYVRAGRLVTRLHFTTHDKVTDIHYRQGPIERACGLASLTFATAGGDVHLPAVRDAFALKAASEAARDAFVRGLIGDAGATAQPLPLAATDTAPPAPAAPPLEVPAWTGPRPSYLQAGDTPLWTARPRPIAALGSLRSLIGLIPLLIFTSGFEEPRRSLIWLAALAIGVGFLIMRVVQLRRTEYVATDRRVYGRRGVVGTTVSQLTYDKITDITYHQDIVGRLLGYGTVTVQTAGSSQAPIAMVGLADPLAAKDLIEQWRDASVGGSR